MEIKLIKEITVDGSTCRPQSRKKVGGADIYIFFFTMKVENIIRVKSKSKQAEISISVDISEENTEVETEIERKMALKEDIERFQKIPREHQRMLLEWYEEWKIHRDWTRPFRV